MQYLLAYWQMGKSTIQTLGKDRWAQLTMPCGYVNQDGRTLCLKSGLPAVVA